MEIDNIFLIELKLLIFSMDNSKLPKSNQNSSSAKKDQNDARSSQKKAKDRQVSIDEPKHDSEIGAGPKQPHLALTGKIGSMKA